MKNIWEGRILFSLFLLIFGGGLFAIFFFIIKISSVEELLPQNNIFLFAKKSALSKEVQDFFHISLMEKFPEETFVAGYEIEPKNYNYLYSFSEKKESLEEKKRLFMKEGIFCKDHDTFLFCSNSEKMIFFLTDSWKRNLPSLSQEQDFSFFQKKFQKDNFALFLKTKVISSFFLSFLESFSLEKVVSETDRETYFFVSNIITSFFPSIGIDRAEDENTESFHVLFPSHSLSFQKRDFSFFPEYFTGDGNFFLSVQGIDEIFSFLSLSAKKENFAKSVTVIANIKKILENYFGNYFSFEEDFLPLFSGEVSLFLTKDKLFSFLAVLPTSLLAEKKYEKLKEGIKPVMAQIIPEVVSHTLPDGTVIKELFPNEKVLEQYLQNSKNGDFFSFTGTEEISPFSIFKQRNMLFFSQQKSQLSVSPFSLKGDTALFKNIPPEINRSYQKKGMFIIHRDFFPSTFPLSFSRALGAIFLEEGQMRGELIIEK